jgi:hypothetical protein
VTDGPYVDFFLRYLAWREHVLASGQDVQPSHRQLRRLLSSLYVRSEGLTLADIQRAMPATRDAKALVYRLEGIAEHIPCTKRPDSLYPDARIRSVYRLKFTSPGPETEEKVKEVLKTHGPMSRPEIMEHL